MNWLGRKLDEKFTREINVELHSMKVWIVEPYEVQDMLRQIKPDCAQNHFGTKVIDPKQQDIWEMFAANAVKEVRAWRYIAQQRVLIRIQGCLITFAGIIALAALWHARR